MERLEVKRMQVRQAVRDAYDMDRPIEVRQIMTPSPHCTPPETNVLDLVKLLNRKGHRHLLVMDEQNRLTGVISDRDIGRCFGPGKYPDEDALARITAAEIMSGDVITISPGMSLSLAVTMMIDHGISCLPVVAGNTLVGIITDTDLRFALQALLGERLVPAATSTTTVAQ